MIDGSFKGFTPPPHSSGFSQGEFEFASKASRVPVVLESFQLPVHLIEIKRACEEYSKKSFLGRLFSTQSVVTKIIEFNNHLNDRVLTLNRNTVKVHSSLEDLATDLEFLRKEVGDSKNVKQGSTTSDYSYQDRISSLEAEQRQFKMLINNLSESTGKPSMLLWAIGVTALNILIAYGIFNSLA